MKRPTTKAAREKETLRRMTEALGRDAKAKTPHVGKMKEEVEKCAVSTAKA
jgi:hypothetical protein